MLILSEIFHTLVAVGLLVGFFDGVNREFTRLEEDLRLREEVRRLYNV